MQPNYVFLFLFFYFFLLQNVKEVFTLLVEQTNRMGLETNE
jgi:hypothetical protein